MTQHASDVDMTVMSMMVIEMEMVLLAIMVIW